jgi:hypothetical protein
MGKKAMQKLNNRTLALLVLLGVILLLITNPNGLISTLSVIQSVVFIILGCVATLYLWKRL